MKNPVIFILILFFTAAFPYGSFCEKTSISEWAPYSGVEGLISKDNILAFNSTSPMPLLASKSDIFINASRQKILEVRMKSDKSYMTGRLFFRRIGDAGFNFNNSFEFQTGLNNMRHKYIIDLSRNPNWFGTVTQMMFSPISGSGRVEIDSVDFIEPNLFLMIAANWQEFMMFERPLPRTINFIFGPRINGISIYSYIYPLIILVSLLLFAVSWVKFKDVDRLFKIVPLKILFVCLFFWILLDSRTAVDQIRSMIVDDQTFGGKSLEEKQALSTNGGFYDFYYYLKFCGKKIPSGSTYSLIVPTNAIYFMEKSKYYLYPIRESAVEAEYTLVYDPHNMLKENEIPMKGHRTFADFGNNRYILKRNKTL